LICPKPELTPPIFRSFSEGSDPDRPHMKFVQLNRSFLPIAKDQQPRLEAGRLWGHKFGGWLDWPDLRQRKRVVLLAEASCGKSDEFRNQVEEITAAGSPAFMVRVEELADQAFEAGFREGLRPMAQGYRDGVVFPRFSR
jgi:hypothetical protein